MKRLTIALALLAAPALALGPGDGVEFTACGAKGRQGVIEAVTPATFGNLYRVYVLAGREGQSAYRVTVNNRCIVAARPAAPQTVAPELPRVELAVNGRLYVCTPQPAR